MSPQACLVVLTKPPVPGRVKTRLIAPPEHGGLSAEQAAEVHRAFLGDVVEQLVGADFALQLVWALDPAEPIPDLGAIVADLPAELSMLPAGRQHGDGLGARIFGALADAAATYPLVAAIGSDQPELDRATVAAAFGELAGGAPVVLVPASDGGYGLIGVRRESLSPHLFADIAWSTDVVLSTTLKRCAELGLEPRLLPSLHDVDTPADLAALAVRLGVLPGTCEGVLGAAVPVARRTRRLLADLVRSGWQTPPAL